MLAGILDCGKSADNALVVSYFGTVKRDIEVDLDSDCLVLILRLGIAVEWINYTRIKTRLPLRSTSVIASLLERDIVGEF